MATPRLGLVVEDKPTELSCQRTFLPLPSSTEARRNLPRRNKPLLTGSSIYSCLARSPLLWALIRSRARAGYLDTARFVELLNVDSPFKLLRHRRRSGSRYRRRSSTFAFVSNGSAQVELIDFRYTRSMRKRYTRA